MNCDETRDLIQPYIDNELDVHTTLVARDHLESCAACSRVLGLYLRQDSMLREQARAEHVDTRALRERIVAMIRHEPTRPQRLWLRRAWFRVAALFVLTTPILFYFLWTESTHPDATICAAAASDHADHCAPDSAWNASTDSNELAVLARGYGMANGLPDLSSFGFGAPRGKVCRVGEARYLHIVYYGAGQEPLSLFLRSNDGASAAADLVLTEQLGYRVAIASGPELELLLVTSGDEKSAAEIARSIHS